MFVIQAEFPGDNILYGDITVHNHIGSLSGNYNIGGPSVFLAVIFW